MKQHNDVIIWDECNDIDFEKLNLLTIDFASLYPHLIPCPVKKPITLKSLLE